MKRNLLIAIAFLTIQISSAQEEVIKLRGRYDKVKQSLNVVDSSTGDYYIFLEDHTSIHAYRYNKQHVFLGYLRANDLRSRYKNLVGHQIKDEKINLFIGNSNNKKFGVVSFDFKKPMVREQELDFKLKENYLNALSIGDKLYLLSYPARGSQLTIHTFNSDLSFSKNEITFSENSFTDRKGYDLEFSEILKFSKGLGVVYAASNIIEPEVPSTLSVTSNPVKIYIEGSEMVLTSDTQNEFTQFLTIDLDAFSKSVQKVEKPVFNDSPFGVKTNSLIHDNILYQVAANRDTLVLTIRNKDNMKLLQTYTANDDDPIVFKNTPIVQKGGALESYREMEKTSKFLRKITTERPGIAIKKTNNGTEITVGSAIETQSNNGVMLGAMMGGASGAILMASLTSMAGAYGRHKNTKTVEITGLFDANFEHKTGKVSKNIFDAVDQFAENKNQLKAETVFYLDGTLHLGYFDSKEDSFQIVKF